MLAKSIKSLINNIKNDKSRNRNQEPVFLRGFGSFIIKERATKVARNISKETSIVIPAHNIPAFKPAKSFIAQVSGEIVNEEA